MVKGVNPYYRARRRAREDYIENLLQRRGPLHRAAIIRRVRAWERSRALEVSARTVSKELDWLRRSEGTLRFLPPQSPGKYGGYYAYVSTKEHLQDLVRSLREGIKIWRRERGLPEVEEPEEHRDLRDLPAETEIPRAEEGEGMGDFMEWARGKKTVERVEWVRKVTFVEVLDAGDPRLRRAQDG